MTTDREKRGRLPEAEVTAFVEKMRAAEARQNEAFLKAMKESTRKQIGIVEETGVRWFDQNPHAFPVGTKIFVER